MSLKTTILREAMDLFEKEGIDKFSEADLRKKLDISEATFINFFSNREDLLLQSYQQRLDDMGRSPLGGGHQRSFGHLARREVVACPGFE